MAEFTRKALKEIFEAAELEVPKDVLGQLCELHIESSEDAGSTIKDLKKQLKTAEHDRDEALAKVPKDGEETVAKSVFDKLQKDFDSYKTGIDEKEKLAKSKAAVRELLKGAGVSEKHLDSVLRVYDMNGVELDEKGKIKDAEDREKAIKTDWADFIESTGERGAQTHNPPDNDGGGEDLGSLSMADYIAARKKKG